MSNIYACLGDSDDEDRTKVAAKKVADKKEAPKEAAKAAPAAAAAKPAKTDKDGKEKKERKPDFKPKDGEERPKSARAPREPRDPNAPPRAPREPRDPNAPPRPPRAPREPRTETPSAIEGEPRKEDTRGPRRDRDHKGGRGGRGGRGGDRAVEGADGEIKVPRKREHDRRSATGRSGEQRRGGRGPFAFGSEQEEAQKAEKGVVATGEVSEETAAVEEVAVPEEPALPPVKTFEDFVREREESRVNADIFGAVRAREVQADFANLRTADKEDITFVGGVAAPAKKVVIKEKKARNLITDVGFSTVPLSSLGDNDRDYRPDGGRGAGAGGRGAGRGGDRERGGRGRGRDAAAPRPAGARGPSFNDADSFPAL